MPRNQYIKDHLHLEKTIKTKSVYKDSHKYVYILKVSIRKEYYLKPKEKLSMVDRANLEKEIVSQKQQQATQSQKCQTNKSLSPIVAI